MHWYHRLGFRILAPVLGMVALIVAATIWLVRLDERDRALEQARNEVDAVASMLMASLPTSTPEDPEHPLRAFDRQLEHIGDLNQVYLIDHRGVISHTTLKAVRGKRLQQSQPGCRQCHTKGVTRPTRPFLFKDPAGLSYVRTVRAVTNEESCHSCHDPGLAHLGVLVVDKDLSSQWLALSRGRIALIGVGALATGLIVMIVLVHVYVLVQRPASRLLKAAKRLRSGKLGTRVEVRGRGEMRELAEAFNGMASGIKARVKEVKRQSYELSRLYSMAERLGRTILPQEIHEVVVELVYDFFKETERVALVVQLDEEEPLWLHTHKAGAQRINTMRLGQEEPAPDADGCPIDIFRDWRNGDLDLIESYAEGAGIAIPFSAGTHQLGFLCVRLAGSASFSETERNLFPALRHHVTLALDHARLYSEAVKDEALQTYSYRYLVQFLDNAIDRFHRYGHQLAVLLMELDGLGEVARMLGLGARDEALRLTAERAHDAVRASDVICRYKETRLALVLVKCDEVNANLIAERVRTKVHAGEMTVAGKEYTPSLRVGVATLPIDGHTREELLHSVEAALDAWDSALPAEGGDEIL